jgi:PIN domain nuclease of toxin-antitoxin system
MILLGSRAVLLDTCAIIYIFNAEPIALDVAAVIGFAGRHDGVFVSAVSAWEIGMLSKRNRAPSFAPDEKAGSALCLALQR